MDETDLDREREIIEQAKEKYREKYEANSRQVIIEVLDKGLLDLKGIGLLAGILGDVGKGLEGGDGVCTCRTDCGCKGNCRGCQDPIDKYLDYPDPEYMKAWVIKYVSQELQKQR